RNASSCALGYVFLRIKSLELDKNSKHCGKGLPITLMKTQPQELSTLNILWQVNSVSFRQQ
ncbi:hypothetical protein HK096_011665, partial [Nowakowskiella sp. JEL0078]